jgi:hypothetical protein
VFTRQSYPPRRLYQATVPVADRRGSDERPLSIGADTIGFGQSFREHQQTFEVKPDEYAGRTCFEHFLVLSFPKS